MRLLRRGEASVNDLAASLELTDNGVRAHLATLERDGLVEAAGKRPGIRKPETLYRLTPEAEQLFPKAYHVLLNTLLDILQDTMSEDELDSILETLGRSLAERASSGSNGLSQESRIDAAVDVLSSMGGLADVVQDGGDYLIQGHACPLAAVVREHPHACTIAEALLADLTGMSVHEECMRNGTPRCVFRLRAR